MNTNESEHTLPQKVRIAVVGIGGVGGYYGGLLSKYAETSPMLDVIFLARGANQQAISEKGLTVKVGQQQFVTHPTMVTDKAEEVGVVDYVILATKSYDLEGVVNQIKPMINAHTILLPLLNGIDITPQLRKLLPDNEVWYGCVYIIARLAAPGVIENTGNVHVLHFGYEQTISDELVYIHRLFLDSGIEAVLKTDPLKAMWRKFFFISVSASLTTYFNTDFKSLADDEEKRSIYIDMMREILQVARAEKVSLEESLIDDMLRYASSLPAGNTSSMNSDYLAGKSVELETLTGVVIQFAGKHRLNVPVYEKIYNALKTNRSLS